VARKATHLIAIAVLVGCFATLAGADDRARLDEPFEITADRIDYEQKRNLYVAQAHVRLAQSDRSLKARWVAFSTATRIGVAEGDVELLDGTDVLHADFMVFDVDTLQGMLFQGALDAGGQGFQVRAREMIRTGKNTFTLRDGVFSTCRCEPGERLPWQLRASKADVELGGYGKIQNSTFEVLGVPVLWIPWAMFPVKNERETGLLLPDFAFGGRGGAEVGLPFFWAAASPGGRCADAALFLRARLQAGRRDRIRHRPGVRGRALRGGVGGCAPGAEWLFRELALGGNLGA